MGKMMDKNPYKIECSRGSSIAVDASAVHAEEEGSNPILPLNRHQWRVDSISLDSARDMVRAHHYAKGGSNTRCYILAVMPVGAALESDAIAISWWLPPTPACGMSAWPKNPQAVLSLSRLVCVPRAPGNTPSFLLGHVHRFIDSARWPIWITFADEWQGHRGTIYRAAGWLECGRTKPEKTYTLRGRMVSRKAGPKTRTHAEMMALGCEFVGSFSRIRFVRVRPDLREEFEPIRIRLAGLEAA